MNEALKQQIFVTQELNDFNPLQNWKSLQKKYIYIWLLIFIILTISISYVTGTLKIFIFLLLTIQFLVSFWIQFNLSHFTIAVNWDDMDYSKIIKIDLPFITTDKVKHAAYLYIPKELEFSQDMDPVKTMISFHGWGSHHKEMDHYCLPTVEKQKFLYFTMDSFGLGQTVGDKNNLDQVEHAGEFIDLVLSLPFVDSNRVTVVGMSLGAAKTALMAYPNPHIRALIMLSGPFDLALTKNEMTRTEYLLFRLFGFKFQATSEEMQQYSAIHQFKAEGVILAGDSKPTANADRVLLLANKNDPTVTVKNTYLAIEKLQLPGKNYRIFPQGKHIFEGNEPFVALEIHDFLLKIFE
ncbi:MAG: prolyl oligopeptidase family serine peptidase [Candidatus Heimdallarchaeota archaeon]|nr:prolyl oligopeptidase family serine peptidase [Candidatus Heimdallarchaeota archaeon]